MRVFFVKELYMIRYPMKLIPYARQMIWGGIAIKEKFNKPFIEDNIGESWELTCRPEAQSIIENGPYAGRALCDLLGCGYDFPLLIKFIDSHDRLSVQVHPDDDVCDDRGKPLGKTEMWYIIDADEDAHIIYGLKEGFSVEDYAEMIADENFESGLRKVNVKKGDCFFIPAGQVHAIGKGILLAEIQQNSDTTYRLYDYGRLDKDGKPRELHVDKALSVMRGYSDPDIEALRYSDGKADGCLANCDKFKCDLISVDEQESVSISSYDDFIALIFIEGCGEIHCNGESYPARAGDTFYIPDNLSINVCGTLKFISAKAK